MGLFRKKTVCEKCGAAISEKESCLFDYSHNGKNKGQKAIRLCRDCYIDELEDNLRSHPKKAVIIQPSPKCNGYLFYSFRDYLAIPSTSIFPSRRKCETEFPEKLRNLLPQDGEKCSACSGTASYTWCTMNLFQNGNPWDLNLNPDEKTVHLCTDCLVDLLRRKVKESDVRLSAVHPMTDDEDGCFTPWMY